VSSTAHPGELTLTLSLRSDPILEGRRSVARFLASNDVGRHCVQDVLLALTEALSNAARHSGCDTVTIRVGASTGAVEVQVSDQGVGFDIGLIDLCRRPGLFQTEGRGLFLIAAVMDEVSVDCGPGTTLTMRKRILRDC
jgi:serine/threonine-protein kinase RsbW